MSRLKAFAIHLGISLVIFAALAALVVFVWYPDFFFETDGGWQGIRIIVLVDLVLGPLLTLIVYKAGKPGLKMDLTLIGLLQTVCLIAGTYVVYDERPLALVFADGQFNSVAKDSFTAHGLDVPNFSMYPGPSPKRLMVKFPDSPGEQSVERKASIANKLPTAVLSHLYVAHQQDADLIVADSVSISEIKDRDYQEKGIARFLAKNGGELEAYRFYPYAARYEYYYLAFSKDSNELIGSLTLARPPEPT